MRTEWPKPLACWGSAAPENVTRLISPVAFCLQNLSGMLSNYAMVGRAFIVLCFQSLINNSTIFLSHDTPTCQALLAMLNYLPHSLPLINPDTSNEVMQTIIYNL